MREEGPRLAPHEEGRDEPRTPSAPGRGRRDSNGLESTRGDLNKGGEGGRPRERGAAHPLAAPGKEERGLARLPRRTRAYT